MQQEKNMPKEERKIMNQNKKIYKTEREGQIENQPPHSRDFSRAVRRLFNK